MSQNIIIRPRVLITGSSSGIGEAAANLFLSKGFTVFGIDRNKSTIDRTEHQFYHHTVADIRRINQLPEIGNLDHIVLNAGVLYDKEDTIGVNVLGTFNCEDKYVKPSLGTLKSIVILSSIAAHDGQDDRGYVASKGALISYTKHLANQLGPHGVRVNSLSPGAGETPMNKLYIQNVYDDVAKQNLLGRWNQPEEMAKVIYFFCVDNTFCTGQDLLLDGGEMIKTRYVYGPGEGPRYPIT